MSLGIGRQVIGVELRDAALRAALCRRGWRGMRLVDTFSIAAVDTLPAAEVAASFAEWRERSGAGAAWVSVIVPREWIVCRNLAVPLPAGSDLKSVVALQIDGLHPFEDEEVLWDCQALEEGGKTAGPAEADGKLRKVPTRVVVARASGSRELLAWLRQRGVAVSQLTAAPVAASGVDRGTLEPDENSVLLISEGNHVELLAGGAAKPAGASAALLLDQGCDASVAAALISQGIEGLHASAGPGRIALAGCGSLLDRAGYWSVLKAELSRAYRVTELSEFALAESSARSALQGDSGTEFNLLPQEERHYAPATSLWPTYALTALVIVLAVMLGLQGTMQDLRYDRRLESEIESLKPRVAVVSARQDQMSEAFRKLVFLRSVRESSRVPLDVMEDLAQRLPGEAWLQQLQMDGKTATLSGNATSASEVLQAMSAATQLESAQFLSAILRSNEGQESFRIGARLRQPLK